MEETDRETIRRLVDDGVLFSRIYGEDFDRQVLHVEWNADGNPVLVCQQD